MRYADGCQGEPSVALPGRIGAQFQGIDAEPSGELRREVEQGTAPLVFILHRCKCLRLFW